MPSEQAKKIADKWIEQLIRDCTKSVWNGAAYCSFDEIDWDKVRVELPAIIDAEMAKEREAVKILWDALELIADGEWGDANGLMRRVAIEALAEYRKAVGE